jgi:hypothetical protein
VDHCCLPWRGQGNAYLFTNGLKVTLETAIWDFNAVARPTMMSLGDNTRTYETTKCCNNE